MTATVEQVQGDLPRWLGLVGQGAEVIVTQDGQAVAKLSTVTPPRPRTPEDHLRWLARLDRARAQHATGKAGPTVEQIIGDDRSERGA